MYQRISFVVLISLAWAFPHSVQAADIVRLTEETWDNFAPHGKEVDCIYGDFVFRNDHLTFTVANPIPGRHANMGVRDVGGCIIDLTRRAPQSDQLSCYYPKLTGMQMAFAAAGAELPQGKTFKTTDLANFRVNSPRVYLTCRSPATDKLPAAEITYTLEDGWDYVQVDTVYTNQRDVPQEFDLADAIRADKTFDRPPAGDDLFYVNDRFFRQGYGVLVDQHRIKPSGNTLVLLRQGGADDKTADHVVLPPGQSYSVHRKIFPGDNLFHVRQVARQLRQQEHVDLQLRVVDASGKPVVGAEVLLPAPPPPANPDPAATPAPPPPPLAQGFTTAQGLLKFSLAPGAYELKVQDIGREPVTLAIDTGKSKDYEVKMVDPGYVAAKITSEQGGPIPCKVQFRGLENTPDPEFAPDSAAIAVRNLYYSHTGTFRQPIWPGKYQVIISYGPEYDAIFTEIDVVRGQDTPLTGKLVRTVKTPGWVSADFHNHSTPSGDNTASQLGRVLNILCEHVEYAPCTEHNRVSSYLPHLRQLGVTHLMATCSGIELTGKPLPLNHQNAFPLIEKPRTQDGGGPTTDDDPEMQIARLALWDNNSDKLVQQNHPDIGWLFFDKNGDKMPDEGFSKALPYMDVIEIHPIEWLLKGPIVDVRGRQDNNRVFNWLQVLNQGIRIPGVVNTDSHYNYHESGFWRNYIQSPTDDPAKIETLDIVKASEQGRIIMTTAPYLEVLITADGDGKAQDGEGGAAAADKSPAKGTAGEDVVATSGKCTLHVRVQCANWYDIDRVQVYLNGRPDPKLNFTRAKNREMFQGGVVRFDQAIPLELASDTHVLVFAVGENSTLGPVQGPLWGNILPAAINNPIYVDVDGGGFKANKDTLDAPLPVRSSQ